MKKSFLILIICAILVLHWMTRNTDIIIPKDFSHKAQTRPTPEKILFIKKNSNFK